MEEGLVLIPITVQTLIMLPPPSPSILVLCPEEDYGKKETCRIVPILIGIPEATQLSLALEDRRLDRPTTHDLFMDALTNLDATVHRVEIYRVDGKVFYSLLYLQAGDRTITLDARPSDAISLAIRQNAPIAMADDVLQKASFPYIFKNPTEDQKEMDEFREFVQNLNPDDFLQDEE